VSEEDSARLGDLAAVIAKETARLGELKRKSEGLSAAAAALEAQIDGAGGEALKRQRATVGKLQVRGVCVAGINWEKGADGWVDGVRQCAVWKDRACMPSPPASMTTTPLHACMYPLVHVHI
jgi:hypothetical protein